MPIHRHPALAPLSRDHHLALQLAAALRKDGSPHLRSTLPSAPRALAAHVCRFFDKRLGPHFVTEESELMVAVDGLDRELDATCADLRRDHDRMRTLIADLACVIDESEITELLERFGTLLEAHVRAEERTFFARVQAVVDPSALSELAPRLLRH